MVWPDWKCIQHVYCIICMNYFRGHMVLAERARVHCLIILQHIDISTEVKLEIFCNSFICNAIWIRTLNHVYNLQWLTEWRKHNRSSLIMPRSSLSNLNELFIFADLKRMLRSICMLKYRFHLKVEVHLRPYSHLMSTIPNMLCLFRMNDNILAISFKIDNSNQYRIFVIREWNFEILIIHSWHTYFI